MVGWLHRELEARGMPMVVLETHHSARMLEAQRNNTDRNDARGLAQLMRSGWFKPVHAKSDAAIRMKLLLAHRRTLKRKLMDIETEVGHSLKMFGLMAGQRVQRASFVARIRELTAGDALLEVATESMLTCWQVLWDEYRKLLVQLVGREELCRRWCEIPGVGPVAGDDVPRRGRRSASHCQVEDARCAFWPDAETRAVGHLDRPRRP
jgi:transposase